jgi:HD-GYP domain-containing protein (c-di-GMP phosphodiesterase class II)
VEVQGYDRLASDVASRLTNEPVILIADLKEFTRLPGHAAATAQAHGRALLLTRETELGEVPLENLRAYDICDRGLTPGLLTFKLNKAINEVEFEREVQGRVAEDDNRRKALDSLNDIGMALSTEKDLAKLLDMIVTNSREMTWADACSLYLIEPDPAKPEDPQNYFANKRMRFQVAQNDSKPTPFKSFVVDISKRSIYGYVALTQEHLSIPDVYECAEPAPGREYIWGGKNFDATTQYRTMSMLAVPMVNWRGETIGVIQLINRKVDRAIKLEDPATCEQYIQPFTEHDVRVARSIASQASIAIQNTELVNSIRTLFDGFIAASVKAIESRDPTTSGHSQRVATLTVGLAQKVSELNLPQFPGVRYTHENLQEIRYASLLHDFGKIGVREHVLVKAKKLYPEEMTHVMDRFEAIRSNLKLAEMQRQIDTHATVKGKAKSRTLQEIQERMDASLKEVQDYLDFIRACNEPTVLAQGGFERLHDIAKRQFMNSLGEQVPFLKDKELVSLSVPKGSLNENDRREIESHVTHTYKFLTTIPWTPDLRRVPDIAYAHHEKLDGTGYPNKLNAEQIPLQAKMMTIADIYDALTAQDRPYKKALPVERALNILAEECKSGHIDKALLDVFIQSELYKLVV